MKRERRLTWKSGKRNVGVRLRLHASGGERQLRKFGAQNASGSAIDFGSKVMSCMPEAKLDPAPAMNADGSSGSASMASRSAYVTMNLCAAGKLALIRFE